jgi:hypothetical protein
MWSSVVHVIWQEIGAWKVIDPDPNHNSNPNPNPNKIQKEGTRRPKKTRRQKTKRQKRLKDIKVLYPDVQI